MKKPLASRIVGLAVLYCLIFFILVILQFSNKGSFSVSAGAMTIRGRYLNSHTDPDITGGIRVYFGGLEFSLNEVRGKGLTLVENGRQIPVDPEIFSMIDTTARFGLPDGSIITFSSTGTERRQELLISAEFSKNASEIIIPITPRRSSLIRDNDQLGIMYSGSRYLFGNGSRELEEGRVVLSKETGMVSYRSRERQKSFEPANYIIAQANNYESAFLNWRELSFIHWGQNAAALQDEFDITGYCTEALVRGNYLTAVNAISRDFINGNRHTFRPAAFVGGMGTAHRTFTAAENSKLNLITSLARDRSSEILKEEHILNYLFVRSNTSLAYDVIDIIQNLQPELITIDYCPGLLEIISDLRRWRPAANNPINPLTEQILAVISENLVRNTEKDLVLASNSEGTSAEFSMRLGKALIDWAQNNNDSEWLAVGKSLVLSALASEGPGAGKLYSIINSETNYPRAVWLMDNSLWAWTSASSARASYIEGNINIAFNFPINMTHYVIIRGVRPFNRIQIHGMDWRTDSQFERYDSSGWVYHAQDQILILKLRHRETVENVRIIYRAEPAPTPPSAEGEADS
ncbi:MAG: hypothetical protein LBU88_10260 [Treponema sp.]|jgi:hypothetical protein|nr:hypothetical protein [Treponema sp.]